SSDFRRATDVNSFKADYGNTGAFRFDDATMRWAPIGKGLTGDQADALVVDPKTSATLFAGNASGVFKSVDGGANWALKTTGVINVRALVVDPTNSKIVYAGADGGVYKSDDGGETWKASNTGLTSLSALTLMIDPRTPTTLYAGTNFGGLFKSVNSGAIWRPVNGPTSNDPASKCPGCLPSTNARTGQSNANAQALAMVPSADATPATIYVGLSGGVYKSVDGGASWSASNGPTNPDPNAKCVDCLPNTNVETGASASQVLSIVINPLAPAIIYASVSDAGIYKSVDGGATWK